MRLLGDLLLFLGLTIFVLSLPIAGTTFGKALRRVAAGSAATGVGTWVAGAIAPALFASIPVLAYLIGFPILSVISYVIVELRNAPVDEPAWTDFRRAGGKTPIRPDEREPIAEDPGDTGHVR